MTIRNGTVDGSVSLGENRTTRPMRGTLSKVRVLGHVDTWGASTVADSHLYAGLSAFGAISLEHNTIRGGVRVDDSLARPPRWTSSTT